MNPPYLLLIPRLYLGLIFTVAAVSKLTGRGDFARPLAGFVTQVGLRSGYGWYRPVLHSLVLPHVHVIATLVIIAECCVAISMLFGLATRAGAAVAIFLLLNYVATKGTPWWSPASNDIADIVLALVVLLGAAGRYGGIDLKLRERFPRIPLW
jgi:uncharacterized membrane protein YphA (DoxX/SURF4 family)